MPVHDWTRVDAGIFHHFHHDWITEIARTLNDGLLPDDYYAMAEQQAAGFGPDVLTLQAPDPELAKRVAKDSPSATILSRPRARFTAQTDAEFYRRKKSSVVVRHVSNDRIVAVVEILSPGNKASRNAFRAFIDKVCDLLENKIHLLLVETGLLVCLWKPFIKEPLLPCLAVGNLFSSRPRPNAGWLMPGADPGMG